jgi:hypothetical protein
MAIAFFCPRAPPERGEGVAILELRERFADVVEGFGDLALAAGDEREESVGVAAEAGGSHRR